MVEKFLFIDYDSAVQWLYWMRGRYAIMGGTDLSDQINRRTPGMGVWTERYLSYTPFGVNKCIVCYAVCNSRDMSRGSLG